MVQMSFACYFDRPLRASSTIFLSFKQYEAILSKPVKSLSIFLLPINLFFGIVGLQDHIIKQFMGWLHLIKQNKMVSTPPAGAANECTPSRSHSHHSSESPSSRGDTHTKYDTFMQRFKLNQHELKSKFRKFVLKQKVFFPRTHQRLNQTFMTEDSDQLDNDSVREIRKEKQRLIEELNQSMNQSHYYLHRNQEFEKTCHQLERRLQRVESIRQERKEEVGKLEIALRSISESIHHEKRRFRDEIKASKDSLQRSKVLCSRRKLSLAVTVRNESQLFRSRIIEERTENEEYNRRKYLSVKAEERNAELSVSRVVEEKIGKAREVKLERLFRELAEKEEVKISSVRAKQETGSIIAKYKNKTVELQEKIGHYRKSLGERQPEPTPRITLLKFQNRRYFTEENQFSTKSGFLTASKQVNYADEPFDD